MITSISLVSLVAPIIYLYLCFDLTINGIQDWDIAPRLRDFALASVGRSLGRCVTGRDRRAVVYEVGTDTNGNRTITCKLSTEAESVPLVECAGVS
jgi:hypothetical protein